MCVHFLLKMSFASPGVARNASIVPDRIIERVSAKNSITLGEVKSLPPPLSLVGQRHPCDAEPES